MNQTDLPPPDRDPPPTDPVARPVLYCGDPHGRFDHILRAAESQAAAAVVLLGDLEASRPLDVELAPLLQRGVAAHWIHGNHDTDSVAAWRHLAEGKLAAASVHARVAFLTDGTRLAGLGGIFRAAVWYPDDSAGPVFQTRRDHARRTPRHDRWQGGPPLRHASSIYPEDVERLMALRADILVTHEAPGYHPHGMAELDRLARAMGVKAVVHGHHHDRLDSSALWAAQGFRSHGVGLRGITAIDRDGNATVVVPGELDAQRSGRRIWQGEGA